MDLIPCPHCERPFEVPALMAHVGACALHTALRGAAAAWEPHWPAAAVKLLVEDASDARVGAAAPPLLRERNIAEVVPGVFISDQVFGFDPLRLRAQKLVGVCNCVEPLAPELVAASGVAHYTCLNIRDDEDLAPGCEAKVLEGAAALAAARAASGGGAVLVHCGQGVSRSATVLLAYLMQHHVEEGAPGGLTLLRALDLAKAARPCICPNKGFMALLLALELRLHGRNSIPPAMACALRAVRAGAAPPHPPHPNAPALHLVLAALALLRRDADYASNVAAMGLELALASNPATDGAEAVAAKLAAGLADAAAAPPGRALASAQRIFKVAEHLYVGTWMGAADLPLLRGAGICGVISCVGSGSESPLEDTVRTINLQFCA